MSIGINIAVSHPFIADNDPTSALLIHHQQGLLKAAIITGKILNVVEMLPITVDHDMADALFAHPAGEQVQSCQIIFSGKMRQRQFLPFKEEAVGLCNPDRSHINTLLFNFSRGVIKW
ncbi:hypothetical protein, partial [Anaerotruncus colihominis]|uniref:hypothetical protein n=1 Tax=Anaerotruncus colihominis TaxID=169435 RepID=UPI00210E1467